MDPARAAVWARRGLAAVTATALVVLALVTWLLSNAVADRALVPGEAGTEPVIEVVGVSSGRITLERAGFAEQAGVFGLVGPDGYGQVSTIVEVRETEVERTFRRIDGDILAGDVVGFEEYAFAGDPLTAHGIPFSEERIAGPLGVYPAWLVDGDRDTWVIVVHGKGDTRLQALRIIPALHDDRYPVLVPTYRNDPGAPASDDGLYSWGLDEWRDIEAAIEFALARGADDVVLMGYGMGGSITAMVLHESLLASAVRGVVWDAPALDLRTRVDVDLDRGWIPGWLRRFVEYVAGLRFGIDWGALDQVARAAEFDFPILLIHGTDDDEAPIWVSEAFGAARPDLVSLRRFDDAGHLFSWNVDPARYETAVVEFVATVSG
jgi:uncharacterized protein